MPLFYQHNINGNTRLGVWHITEDDAFFLQKATLQKAVRHPHKRLQHLAGRYLLRELDPDFPVHEIRIAETNKPQLPDASFHFSISHCGDYAAAIISGALLVGIDIEVVTRRIQSIQHKFLSSQERVLVPPGDDLVLTILWSCKEAVYKWYGRGEVDFSEHIRITGLAFRGDRGEVRCDFMKGSVVHLALAFRVFNDICLAWLVHEAA